MSLEELEYDKNSQRVYLLPGMPIIARVNSKGKKGLGFVNNQPFTIKKIDYINKNIIIEDTKDIKIHTPIDQFQKCFMLLIVLRCINHKGKHIIMHIRYMNSKDLMTALNMLHYQERQI